jgi:hypothetical protein
MLQPQARFILAWRISGLYSEKSPAIVITEKFRTQIPIVCTSFKRSVWQAFYTGLHVDLNRRTAFDIVFARFLVSAGFFETRRQREIRPTVD